MAQVKMSLQEAAEHLGLKPNGVRSRMKAGKLLSERDNSGRIFVWIDTNPANDEGSKSRLRKPSIEEFEKPSKPSENNALELVLETLREQLTVANAEISELRVKAAQADRLAIENAGLQAASIGLQTQLDIRIEQLAELRALLAKANDQNAEQLRQWAQQQPAKGFFARLFGKS